MKTYHFNTLDDVAEHFERRAARERAEANGLKVQARNVAHARAGAWAEAAALLRSSAVREASKEVDLGRIVS